MDLGKIFDIILDGVGKVAIVLALFFGAKNVLARKQANKTEAETVGQNLENIKKVYGLDQVREGAEISFIENMKAAQNMTVESLNGIIKTLKEIIENKDKVIAERDDEIMKLKKIVEKLELIVKKNKEQ